MSNSAAVQPSAKLRMTSVPTMGRAKMVNVTRPTISMLEADGNRFFSLLTGSTLSEIVG